MTDSTSLKHLPAVDQILQYPAIRELCDRHGHACVVAWIRSAVDQLRQQILAGQSISPADLSSLVESETLQLGQAEQMRYLQKVINATGILLHTNLGRAPLSDLAVERMCQAAAYCNVELDLQTGKRSRRGDRALRLLCQLTGAEEALVVNNCAAATLLVLQALAVGREVIISRGQLVEIGGGFRLPDVFRSAGVLLKEVGTTNRSYVSDYEAALNEQTAAIIRVHHSNFLQAGFVAEPSIDALVAIKRPAHVPVIDDLGSGSLVDPRHASLTSEILAKEPNVRRSIATGADLCLFSGDKLFGGPQCGIIVGKRRWIQQLRNSPLMRALRVDKVTLAAFEATAEIHLRGEAERELPFFRMLSKTAGDVRATCEWVLQQLEPVQGVEFAVEACQSQIGGGSVPGYDLESFAITLKCKSSQLLADALRKCRSTPVLCRQTQDRVLLDLRTVSDQDLPEFICTIRAALTEPDRTPAMPPGSQRP
ncbi:MAG: L-seryl-tRNA(Sec) selenium transferase [bacterium]|nr:L-seryl-tRNA(Sec) selenium transferase [bacterium]